MNQNDDEQGNLIIKLAVQNAGVGPAKVKTFEVFWDDQPMKGSVELLRACCGYQMTGFGPETQNSSRPMVPSTSIVAGNVIRAGESIKMLSLPLGEDNKVVWHRLDAARFKMRFRACYCSVFDECWISDLAALTPKPVRACMVPIVAYQE